MTDHDSHLGTGRYDPATYWDARARHAGGSDYQAVCAFGLSDGRNRAMEKIQARLLQSALASLDLGGARVLEFGCGIGRWAPSIARRGALYFGVDVSPHMLGLARRRVPSAGLAQIDGQRLPLPDGSFDLAFAITVLHHNPHDRQDAIIGELVRTVRPGGHLVLMEAVNAAGPGRPSFNMFPRPLEDWVAEVTRGGRAEVVSVRLARWWPALDALDRLARRLRLQRLVRTRLADRFAPALSEIEGRLMPLLPAQFASTATMLFLKR